MHCSPSGHSQRGRSLIDACNCVCVFECAAYIPANSSEFSVKCTNFDQSYDFTNLARNFTENILIFEKKREYPLKRHCATLRRHERAIRTLVIIISRSCDFVTFSGWATHPCPEFASTSTSLFRARRSGAG